MKTLLFLFVLATLSVYCLPLNRNSSFSTLREPARIILRDSALAITLEATRSGADWVISSGNPGNYLCAVAKTAFNLSPAGSFQAITLVFAPSFEKGALAGVAPAEGNLKIPVGVVYALEGQLDGVYSLKAEEKHTCTSAPCSCCDFVKREDGTIKGCKCIFDNDCQHHPGDSNRCDHTVTTGG
ncbi:MAG: hypothetical protein IPH12_01275 [Saprospirales bacterium]|nr:hypothetical protein [Saprospirales bacterium]